MRHGTNACAARSPAHRDGLGDALTLSWPQINDVKRQTVADRITVSFDEGVADVRLSRADKMNALDQAMFDALIATGEALATRPGLRAVVLSGEGRAFCAGLDMGRFEQMAGAGSAVSHELRLGPRSHGLANASQHAVLVWQKVPVPVIAAVHGVAFGGGLQVALGADLRYVTPDARLSILEIKWGLVPDMGGTVLLQGMVRADVIRELTWTGRVVSGVQAVELGLCTRVADDPRTAALQTAREIAGKSPDAIRAGKRLLKLAQAGDSAATLQAESDEQIRLLGSRNQVESVRANLEKRLPAFIDPS